MTLQVLRNTLKSLGNLRRRYIDDSDSDDIPGPSNIPVPSDDIPRNILAFRTITMMLSILQPKQSSGPDSGSDPYRLTSEDRREVRISDAMAHLAILDNDVVAVATEYREDEMIVVACTSTPEDPSPPELEKQPPKGYVNQIKSFLFVKNFRRDDPPTDPVVKYPIVTSAMPPEDMGSQTLSEYLAGSADSKPKVTLASHLWILSKLIFTTISDDEDDGGLNILMKYIITTCHKKMERRFKHDLSDRHFQSLKNVENFTFNPELQVDTDLDKILNDRAFITGFVSRTKLQPKLLASLELSPIPNIQRMCDNLPHESEPFQLYTSETCTEFHNLVVGLLVKFKKSCFSLAKEKGNTFRSEVASMIVCGHTLLRIARGSAFEMHLQNIASLLEDHRTEISMPKDDAVSEELLPVLLSITDEGQPIPLWKTYRDWMQLMVVYFDAAKILTTYAASQSHPFKAVSFKILATPPVDDRFLPYPELLTDSLLFPVADASGKPVKNEEILEFLDKGFKSLEAAKRNEKIGGHIMRLWEKRAKKEYKQISKNLSTLKGLLNSESVHDKSMNKDIEEILELLLNWNNDQDNDTLKNNITDKIRSLNDELVAEKNSNPFPTDLVQALKKFKGTCHCECCFASILHEGTRSTMVANEYKDLLEETKHLRKRFGVSKRCCPSCRIYLSILSRDSDQFITRGSHNTLSPCTLPTWTPASIVDSMNAWFGLQLRRELVKLMSDSSKPTRDRAHSANSQRLSIDSIDRRERRNPKDDSANLYDSVIRDGDHLESEENDQ